MFSIAGKRSLKFYSELVLVTVLSLVAANTWIRLLTKSLDRYFPGSLIVDFLVAVIATIFAIYILNMVFKKEESVYDSPKKDDGTPIHGRGNVLDHHKHFL